MESLYHFGVESLYRNRMESLYRLQSESVYLNRRNTHDICIAQDLLEDVVSALEKGGLFQEEASGEIWLRKAPKAYTYN